MTVLAATGEGYVAAAYLVFLALLLIYLVIVGVRISRTERELSELGDLAAKRDAASAPARPEDEVRA